jgi:thiol-disulfide isomerase/thioredoxin
MSKARVVCLWLAFSGLAFSSFAQSRSESKSPDSSQALLDALDRADAFATQRQYQQALDAYRQADQLANHSCADCDLGKANMECYLGDFASALDDSRHAQTAAGSNRILAADACDFRAKLLVATSSSGDDAKVKEAEAQLRQALALDPKKSSARYELGMLLVELGRDKEGVDELRAYVASPLASPRYVDRANRIIADPSRARALPSEDFSIKSLEGGTISKAGLRGKVVLLDFWASWCGPCRVSMPAIADLRKKLAAKTDFEIVGISADEDESAWKQFVKEHDMNWPEAIDLDGQIRQAFEVPGFPTYVLLDRDGGIVFRQTGFDAALESTIAVAVTRALAKPLTPQPAPSPSAAPAPSPQPLPSAAVSEAAPLRPVHVHFLPPPDDVGNDDVRGGVYRNEFLGLKCAFPGAWTAAQPDELDSLNRARMRAIERAEQARPSADVAADGSLNLPFAQIVFAASPDARYAAPSFIISVAQTDAPVLDAARHDAEDFKAQGVAILAAPHEVFIARRSFVRTETQAGQSDNSVWTSMLETTVSQHFRVTLEIRARSKQELDQLDAMAQSLVITKP